MSCALAPLVLSQLKRPHVSIFIIALAMHINECSATPLTALYKTCSLTLMKLSLMLEEQVGRKQNKRTKSGPTLVNVMKQTPPCFCSTPCLVIPLILSSLKTLFDVQCQEQSLI